ncbi:MAG TPA: sensor domain-containing protein [Mycobacterium sp.]|nr:sensor domain-containing protein [Mycobacterium sp.]HTX93652.1 sensor domain-containing protein [Mycobacterium sp.]
MSVLASACTSVVAGTAAPSAGLKPRPVTGQTVKQVLLDDAELSKLLGQPLTGKPRIPPRFGGPEMLQPAIGVVSPVDCAGVTTMLEQSAYRPGRVTNAARETWWNIRGTAKAISVAEGIVALPTAAEAGALFENFSQQWLKCDGTTVTIERTSIVIGRPEISLSDTISDVRVADSVLAAALSIETRLSGAPPSGPRPDGRAIGVRGNCLVEVDVAFFGAQTPTNQAAGEMNTNAIDIAHAMMAKVSALS